MRRVVAATAVAATDFARLRAHTRILYALLRPHNGLGAQSEPRRLSTSRGLRRDIRGGALD
jgi:hypothetical protein